MWHYPKELGNENIISYKYYTYPSWWGVKDEHHISYNIDGKVSAYDMSCYCQRMHKETRERYDSLYSTAEVKRCDAVRDIVEHKTTVKTVIVVNYD
mgnify:FL=1